MSKNPLHMQSPLGMLIKKQSKKTKPLNIEMETTDPTKSLNLLNEYKKREKEFQKMKIPSHPFNYLNVPEKSSSPSFRKKREVKSLNKNHEMPFDFNELTKSLHLERISEDHNLIKFKQEIKTSELFLKDDDFELWQNELILKSKLYLSQNKDKVKKKNFFIFFY